MATLKINKNLNNEINRLIKNYNSKVARLKKLDKYNLKIIPDKVSKKELLKDIVTNKELRIELNKLKSFSKRGAEDVVTFKKTGESFSKWEIQQFKNEKNRAIRQLNQKIKYYKENKPNIFGKNLDVTFAQMADSHYLYAERNLNKIKNKKISELTRKGAKRGIEYFKNFNEHSDLIAKQNYIQSIINLGYASGVPMDKINTIKNKLISLPEKELVNLINNDNGVNALLNKYRVYGYNLSKGKEISIEFLEETSDLIEELYNKLDKIIK